MLCAEISGPCRYSPDFKCLTIKQLEGNEVLEGELENNHFTTVDNGVETVVDTSPGPPGSGADVGGAPRGEQSNYQDYVSFFSKNIFLAP